MPTISKPIKVATGRLKNVPTTDSFQLATLGLGVAPSDDALSITASAAGNRGLLIKGAASQSANLLEIQDSSSNVLFALNSSGQIALEDNTADALVIAQGANKYYDIDTSDTGEEQNWYLAGSAELTMSSGALYLGGKSSASQVDQFIRAADSTGDSVAGGSITITAGLGGDSTGTSPGAGGPLTLSAGNAGSGTAGGTALGGAVTIEGGDSGGTNSAGSATIIKSGRGRGNGSGGDIFFQITEPGASGDTLQTWTNTLQMHGRVAHFSVGDNSGKLCISDSAFTDLGTNATCFGYESDATQEDTSSFGNNARSTGAGSSSFGQNSAASGIGAMALGRDTSAGHDAAIALGDGAATTAINQLVVKGAYDIYFGDGVSAASVSAVTINSTAGGADSVNGSALTISAGDGGDSTGTSPGAGGTLTLKGGDAGDNTAGGTGDGGSLVINTGTPDGGSNGTIDLQINSQSSLLLSGTVGKYFVPNATLGFTDAANSVYGSQSVLFGHQTDASSQSAAVGYAARAPANTAIAFGYNTHAGSAGSIAIGANARSAFGVSAGSAIAIGSSAQSQELNGIAIGASATVSDTHNGSIALGSGAATDAAGQLAIGADGSSNVISDVVIGRGSAGSNQPTNVTIRNTDNTSSNLNAGSLTIKAAQATDTPGADAGNGGSLVLVAGKGGDGASGFRPGDGGDLNLTAGDGGTFVDLGNSDGGDVNINAGATVGGTGTNGSITIGTTTADTIGIGHSGTSIGFFGATPSAQPSDFGALTDNTGSTPDNTIAQVSGTGADATINDNFADLADQVNLIRTVLRDLGLMA